MTVKFTFEFVKKYIESLGWILHESQYGGGRKKMKCECPNGHLQYKNFESFRAGEGCKRCKDDSIRLSENEVREYIESFGYKLLSHYHTSGEPVTVMCDKGHIYEVNFNAFKSRGSRCNQCFHERFNVGIARKSNLRKRVESGENLTLYPLLVEEWDYENNDGRPEDYLPMADYKAGWICSKCGNHWNAYIYNRTNMDSGCPSCRKSKGEEKIGDFLKYYEINYISQCRFEDCVNVRPLPFDFYLPDYNLCIEYHGEQHYSDRMFFYTFGRKDGFKELRKRDKIKEKYCKKNKIDLLIIPYTDFYHIDQILTEALL